MPDADAVDDRAPDALLNAWLEEARVSLGKGLFGDAVALLGRLLAQSPSHVAANALMAEVLFADKRIGEAGAFITAALAGMPENPRLHILRGNMLRACGDGREADAAFRAALALDRHRLGAWTGLIALAVDRRDTSAAVGLLEEGYAATRDAGLWRGAIDALVDIGESSSLGHAIAVMPQPDVADSARFLPWARTVWRAGHASQVIAALASLPDSLPPDIRAEYHALLADIAREAGDFPQALAERRRALAQVPANRGLRRQLLRALLSVGDLAAAEAELEVLLASRGPQDDVAGEIQPLHEARAFRDAMQALQAAYTASDTPEPSLLARIVDAAPGCLVAATAFIAALRRQQPADDADPVPVTAQALVPQRFWSLDAPDDSWRLHHPDARREVLAYAPLPSVIESALPVPRTAFRRLPWDVQVDVLRMTTLWLGGGWWYPAARECHGSLPALAGQDTRLLLVVDEQGWLVPDCVGCCAGDPVIAQVREMQAAALQGPLRGSDTRWQAATTQLTLAAARVLAARMLRGDRLTGIRIITAAEFRRRIA